MKMSETLVSMRPGWWAFQLGAVAVFFGAGFGLHAHLSTDEAHGDEGDAHQPDAHPVEAHDSAAHQPEAHHSEAHQPEGHHSEAHPTDAHAEPAHSPEGHDHSAGLRPLMQSLLVDTVALQGALSDGDFALAAARAGRIADACDDGPGAAHDSLPVSWGPDFLTHDQALHENAGRLRGALQTGDQAEIEHLNRELIGSCEGCHQQAPAASAVELEMLTAFADRLQESTGSGSTNGAPLEEGHP